MNKKTYNKPEIRERERIIVTTMICQSIVFKKRRFTKSGNEIEGGQQTSINPWDAD